ncbi:MAG: HAMP domain-containing protein [Anaerolineae bacterium]|nr:HAMP domain-containing protein [Anaerolineae bacterium]
MLSTLKNKLRQLWNNLPLRIRLTFFYVGLLGLLLGIFGGTLYWDTRHFLFQSTTTRIRAQAKPVIERRLFGAGGSSSSSPQALEERLQQIAYPLARDLTSRDTVALVLDKTGQVLADGRLLPEEPYPPVPSPQAVSRALAGENEVNYITTIQGERVLVLLIPLRQAPGSPQVIGVVQLSTPLAPIEQILQRQRLLLALSITGTLLVGTILGLWLTTSALTGLTRMVQTCQRIAQGDLSQRVNLPHHRDEVGQLALAFDEMVARIEALFASQGRFVANAAHELRTPLTALQGSLEVLMRGAQDDPAATARLIQGMYREITRLTRLSQQLLDLTRLESASDIRKQPLELATFFDEFLQQAQLLGPERNISLQAGPPLTLLADADALRRVLFNLVDNAIQHTAPGGTISLGWRRQGDQVAIWVADDGEGIAPEDLPHIFEPFYRGDRSRSRRWGGTGLGLALAKALVEAHGGQIQVSSEPGRGALFTITLPLSQNENL